MLAAGRAVVLAVRAGAAVLAGGVCRVPLVLP
jgi:hypothetical protein